jgi:hypothetical protein
VFQWDRFGFFIPTRLPCAGGAGCDGLNRIASTPGQLNADVHHQMAIKIGLIGMGFLFGGLLERMGAFARLVSGVIALIYFSYSRERSETELNLKNEQNKENYLPLLFQITRPIILTVWVLSPNCLGSVFRTSSKPILFQNK